MKKENLKRGAGQTSIPPVKETTGTPGTKNCCGKCQQGKQLAVKACGRHSVAGIKDNTHKTTDDGRQSIIQTIK